MDRLRIRTGYCRQTRGGSVVCLASRADRAGDRSLWQGNSRSASRCADRRYRARPDTGERLRLSPRARQPGGGDRPTPRPSHLPPRWSPDPTSLVARGDPGDHQRRLGRADPRGAQDNHFDSVHGEDADPPRSTAARLLAGDAAGRGVRGGQFDRPRCYCNEPSNWGWT